MSDESGNMDARTIQEEIRLNAILARFGSDYNQAPDIIPVEEMWARIAEARRPDRRTHGRRGWQLLAASIALLGVGISVGHEWQKSTHGAAAAQPPRITAAAPQSEPRATTAPSATQDPAATMMAQKSVDRRSRDEPTIVRVVRSIPRSNSAYGADAQSANVATYQLATLRHFTNVEALLTSYNNSKRGGRMDAQLASWSRDLLAQTRLLLDSPAADDPVRRRLLQDLELVLAEMSQLSQSAPSLDRAPTDPAVHNSDIINRLRALVPAGGTMHSNGVSEQ